MWKRFCEAVYWMNSKISKNKKICQDIDNFWTNWAAFKKS